MPVNVGNYCTGCLACKQVCPNNCIHEVYDNDGFSYSKIDYSNCVGCEACKQVCPILKTKDKYVFLSSYAAKRKNDDAFKYASAGVFENIAKAFISRGYEVVGAGFDDNFNVIHKMVDNIDDVDGLTKSKYVQSNLSNIYKAIKESLVKGKKILFAGTPCQVAAIKCVFHNQSNNIYFIQVFCHAVPSPKVWSAYLASLMTRYNAKTISGVDFRYKKELLKKDYIDKNNLIYAWKDPSILITFNNNARYESKYANDPYLNAMNKELITRESCFRCQFKLDMFYSGADISIGDFWGIENFLPDFNNNSGISAVITHTKRGEQLLSLCDKLRFHKVELENIKAGNILAFESDKPHHNRDAFFKEFNDCPLDVALEIKRNIGYLAAVNKVTMFDIFGSHSLRTIVNTVCIGSESHINKHQSNSTIFSIVSSPVDIPNNIIPPSNVFRKKMLTIDFNKSFFSKITNKESVFIFDFLEERFSSICFNDSIITNSDALNDTNFFSVNNMCITKNFNNNAIDLFIKRILDCGYKKTNIIMIETFLVTDFGTKEFKTKFKDIVSIEEINSRLLNMYSYVESKYKFIKVVKTKDNNDVLYCDKYFKHGCYPWHYNNYLYELFAKELLEKIL